MALELVVRFVIGGLVVSAFAVIGDIVRPKAFAGLFSAAPSVALATLGLTLLTKGPATASTEGMAMIAGAFGLLATSATAAVLLPSGRMNSLAASSISLLPWFVVAFSLWAIWLR